MSEKLNAQLPLKVTPEFLDQFTLLAKSEGVAVADLHRRILDEYISKKHREFMFMQLAFQGKVIRDNHVYQDENK